MEALRQLPPNPRGDRRPPGAGDRPMRRGRPLVARPRALPAPMTPAPAGARGRRSLESTRMRRAAPRATNARVPPFRRPRAQLSSDSGSGGIGIVLPIVLGALLLAAIIVAVVRRRRRTDRPRVSVMTRSRGVARRLALTTLALATAVAFWAPAEAGAERGITTGIAVPEAQSLTSSVRDLWLDRTADANADLVRIDVVWRRVVGSARPANPRDPADPAYDFSRIDAGVRGAEQRGLKVLFTLYGAPDWAEGSNRPSGLDPGAWRPDPGRVWCLRQRVGEAVFGELHSGGRTVAAAARPLLRGLERAKPG